MSEVSAKAQQSEQIDETRVIQYLQDNPELLMKYPDIFSALSIPHQTGAATSLVERQLKLLRDENFSLKSKIDELVGIARENEELTKKQVTGIVDSVWMKDPEEEPLPDPLPPDPLPPPDPGPAPPSEGASP